MFNLKKERRYTFAELRKFTGDFMVGTSSYPHHIISFRDFEELLSSLVFNKTLSILTILLILRRFSQWCRRIFPNLSTSKVEKNRGKVYWQPGIGKLWEQNYSFVHKRLRYKQLVGLINIMISD